MNQSWRDCIFIVARVRGCLLAKTWRLDHRLVVERQASLRQVLLVSSHFVVRVHQHYLATEVAAEGVSCLVAGYTLLGKRLEDLLKRCLGHVVLLDAKLALLVFKLAEEPADSLVLSRDSKLEELTALLQQLDVSKV